MATDIRISDSLTSVESYGSSSSPTHVFINPITAIHSTTALDNQNASSISPWTSRRNSLNRRSRTTFSADVKTMIRNAQENQASSNSSAAISTQPPASTETAQLSDSQGHEAGSSEQGVPPQATPTPPTSKKVAVAYRHSAAVRESPKVSKPLRHQSISSPSQQTPSRASTTVGRKVQSKDLAPKVVPEAAKPRNQSEKLNIGTGDILKDQTSREDILLVTQVTDPNTLEHLQAQTTPTQSQTSESQSILNVCDQAPSSSYFIMNYDNEPPCSAKKSKFKSPPPLGGKNSNPNKCSRYWKYDQKLQTEIDEPTSCLDAWIHAY
ncbi:hypothetical protein BDR26DRAFT_126082 [Obelidium mucronatum]|nr:hypothetical protein BDR26DRAFT_126082 [Obelidium mucronatum]